MSGSGMALHTHVRTSTDVVNAPFTVFKEDYHLLNVDIAFLSV